MSTRRVRLAATGTAVIIAALLSSCSVPAEWAARLNDDGSVDYLGCYGTIDRIEVDYHMPDEGYEELSPEWQAEVADHSVGELRASSVEVAYYGELPEGWVQTSAAKRSPGAWDWVVTTAGSADRDDLVEGEWVWFTNGQDWAWIPPQPCDGWELGPDGEPRRS